VTFEELAREMCGRMLVKVCREIGHAKSRVVALAPPERLRQHRYLVVSVELRAARVEIEPVRGREAGERRRRAPALE